MNQPLQAARSIAWHALAAAVAFFAVRAFLHDMFPHASGTSRISAAVVAVTAAAIIAFPPGSVGRALLGLGSAAVVTFCIGYDALEFLFDDIVGPDWPIALVAVLVTLWLVPVFAIFLFRDNKPRE